MSKHHHRDRCRDMDDNGDDFRAAMNACDPTMGTIPMQGVCHMTPRGTVCHFMPSGMSMGDMDDMRCPMGMRRMAGMDMPGMSDMPGGCGGMTPFC